MASIDQDLTLPAIYVVDPHGQITCAFIDAHFTKDFPARYVLSAVYNVDYIEIKKVA